MEINEILLKAQKNEITEYYIYYKLSQIVKDENIKQILKNIAQQELTHYKIFKKLTGKDCHPNEFKIFLSIILVKILGLNFTLKLMEIGEKLAQKLYDELKNKPEIFSIIKDEQSHELNLLQLIDDRRLHYISSFVLGLNDALVEISGALAGLTLALKQTNLIALVASITGIAASLSMAVSSYLANQEEENRRPILSGLITGLAYIFTVALLVFPYIVFQNRFIALALTIVFSIFIIGFFTFYVSVARSQNFKTKFLKMTFLSLGVALVNFFIGFSIKKIFNVDV